MPDDRRKTQVFPFTMTIYLTECPYCDEQENYGKEKPEPGTISVCGNCDREYVIDEGEGEALHA